MALIPSKDPKKMEEMGYSRLYGNEIQDHAFSLISDWVPK
jgi:hypothetical protein